MSKMFDQEKDRIREDFRKVCRTFLDVFGVAAESDTAWETAENGTDALLWNKIGQLERQLETIAPGTGPRYNRSDPAEVSLHVIALWCGLEDCVPLEVMRARVQ